MVYNPAYLDESDDDRDTNQCSIIPETLLKTQSNSQSNRLDWGFVRSFDNQKLAHEFVQSEKIWSKVQRITTWDGIKQYYRCNLVPYRQQQCPSRLMLLYHAENL